MFSEESDVKHWSFWSEGLIKDYVKNSSATTMKEG